MLLSSIFKIAQISDCHLFSQTDGLHHGANVYHNLVSVLDDIKNQHLVDAIVFTGDITQDHSEKSYQLFVQAVVESDIAIPFYYLAGNHDELELLDKYLSVPPFNREKVFNDKYWQIVLLNSKSETPKGLVTPSDLSAFESIVDDKKHQLVMMHHHPLDVGYFIDQHGLENQAEFWQTINKFSSIKAITCGHVHQALTLYSDQSPAIPLFTCPATSIQFDTNKSAGASNGQGPGYRVFSLFTDGKIKSDSYFLTKE
ncbi:metallophosphoesterase [Colwellia sp. BRX8-7]|nr:metallophosphoesterase [Colwellia sp. BRX8-7]MBA6351559.1 metallophosphoesterase [Colwellia sp. BRX9-1]MBA6364301.1 metallophosphoesterase [Colwellia sp. BRX8-8]MBA6371828.1 metallophosphoesterase [Colwellia sp. BRX8-4]MBA6384380.1 metallophosphoesterase [Colwellia sp. BRX10-9]MBA6394694.1 metallophosphoesterase [Colwellia sp. BRX10-6]